jgi:hypothetical protein
MKSREERLAIQAELGNIRESIEADLISNYEGVVGVGIGLKEVGSELTEEITFIVYVDQKKDEGEIDSNQVLPTTIQGYNIDVQSVPRVEMCAEERRFRPLIGGTQIQGIGTMGCMAQLNADGTPVILTNHHVVYPNNSAAVVGPNDRIGQPGAASVACCCACGDVGSVLAGQRDVNIDAAIARIKGYNPGETKRTHWSNEIQRIGWVAGFNTMFVINEPVRKHGRTTELTSGTITGLAVPVSVGDPGAPGGTRMMTGQMAITSVDANPFIRGGDSGSVLVNQDNEVIGLLHAGGGLIALATPIAVVQATMGITIQRAGTAGVLPLSAVEAEMEEAVIEGVGTEADLARVDQMMNQSENGKALLSWYYKFQPEIIQLINTNREVGAAWQRYKGPSFLGHVLKNLRESEHPIPHEIEGYSRQNLLLKLSDVLEKNGSVELKPMVSEFTHKLLNYFSQGTSFSSFIEAMENDHSQEQ